MSPLIVSFSGHDRFWSEMFGGSNAPRARFVF